MSDAGIVTAQVGDFNVTGPAGSAEALQSLKPHQDKAASDAASQLGKRGAEARAKARESEPEEPAEKTAKPIKPIPPKRDGAAAEPEPEPVEAAEPEETPEEPPKDKRGNPRHDPNARIREATREAAEAKRQRDEAMRRAEAFEARLAALERGERPRPQREAQPQPRSEGKPVAADFDDYDAYLDARDDYNRRQWESGIVQRAQEQAQQHAQTQHLEQAAGRFREAAKAVVGQISEEVGQLRTSFQLAPGEPETAENWIANELVFSPEQAPALMLHFTEHPEDLQRIAALSNPRAVSREMAKLEARLDAATTAPAPSDKREVVSRATPPVRPVTGTPYVTEQSGYREGMSLDEYYRATRRKR